MDRVPVRSAAAGQCASIAFKRLPITATTNLSSHSHSPSGGETSRSASGTSSSSSSSSSDDDDGEDEEGEDEEEIEVDGDGDDEDEAAEASGPKRRRERRVGRRSYRGTVLVSPEARPAAVWEFEAALEATLGGSSFPSSSSSVMQQQQLPSSSVGSALLGQAGGAWAPNQDAVVHVHTLRQAARVVGVATGAPPPFDSSGSDGGKALGTRWRLRFLSRAEYVTSGMPVVLRRGRALAVGRVVATVVGAEGDEGGGLVPVAVRQRRRHSI